MILHGSTKIPNLEREIPKILFSIAPALEQPAASRFITGVVCLSIYKTYIYISLAFLASCCFQFNFFSFQLNRFLFIHLFMLFCIRFSFDGRSFFFIFILSICIQLFCCCCCCFYYYTRLSCAICIFVSFSLSFEIVVLY